ncbi:sensor histidine kinase [Massilia consociata]|uniref:Sensor histidine kinase n=1 Tax=Massilia consociata TaxID=760117 RepID=A0ABV6FIR1_9BURK
MRTQPSRRHADAHSQFPEAQDDTVAATVLRLTQEQMLVNQALVEKILDCKRAEDALRASQQTLHELLAHQLANREAERKRISCELHDSLAQNLLALRIDIVLLHQETAKHHHRLHDRASAALDNVDITLRTVKHLLGELRPAALELGLLATLETEVRKFTRASGIACELHAAPGIDSLALDEETLLTVYRVLQECLNNVFRHSLASRVSVHLAAGDGRLVTTIADNGIGFDPSLPRNPGSYGLLGLEERVAAHGGELSVGSARGQGTRVVLAIPSNSPRKIFHGSPDQLE